MEGEMRLAESVREALTLETYFLGALAALDTLVGRFGASSLSEVSKLLHGLNAFRTSHNSNNL